MQWVFIFYIVKQMCNYQLSWVFMMYIMVVIQQESVYGVTFWGMCWNRTVLCCYDKGCAVLLFSFTQALVFPNQLYEVVFEEELSTTNISVRLYGGALLSKSSLLK